MTAHGISGDRPALRQLDILGFALDHVGEAAYLIDCDARFHYANEQACRALGYSRAELLGLSVPDVDPGYALEQWRQHWNELRQQRSLTFESSHRRRDGSVFPVEITATYFDYHGLAYNLALVRDIGERRSMEHALREQEQQFRTLAEASPNILVRYGWDCSLIYVNPAYLRETGNPRPQATAAIPELTLTGELSTERYRATLKRVMESAIPAEVLLEWRRPDGSIACHDFHIVAERDADGRVVGALGMGHDVSALKRQERLEAMRLHIFERLAQNGELDEVLGLVTRYVEEAQPGFLCSIMVVTADGRHLSSIPTPSLPADYLAAVDGIAIGDGSGSCGTAAWRGEPVIVEDVLDHPYWAPYRELAAKAGLRACWSEPIKDSAGRVLGTFGIYQQRPARPSERDRELLRQASYLAAIAIERRSAEKKLMHHAVLVQSSDDAIIGKDLQGRITSWNKGAEQLFGYLAEEAIGQPVSMLVPETRRDEEATILAQIRSGKTVKHYETVRRCKNGRMIDISVTVSPLRDARGRIVGASKIARDISERKLSDQELRRYRTHLEELVAERTQALQAANRELEAFTYSASHDLRTPLRAIAGFSGMLGNKYGEQLDEEGRRLLQVVRSNAARMSQLIDGILAFSRCGRLQLKTGEVDMERLVHAAWMDLVPLREGRDIRLQLHPLAPARGDPILLRQVWANLLANAIKFTAPRQVAHIEIGGSADAAETHYYIKDDGVGFDQNYAHKLFGVFQRLHAVDEFAGTGIGLAIVKRILGRHGGRVEAEGRLGEGATFHFALPAASPPAPRPNGRFGLAEEP